ncbi:helix-turn-helix domain-containing protein [Nocardia sp. GTS18]|uniref:helix-turn-helix domain-containing protein n=1 Tax=Nocardia sp. GTS18 TaxID=1778064 RepID=UPI0015EF2114|nr:helix-turn-helix domain-containing protein [Nocardia sp. GTS18]
MTSTNRKILRNGTVLPPEDLRELLDLSRFLEQHTETAALLGPDGEQIPLPAEVYEVLVQVVGAMRKRRAVTIAPVEQRLTTQQAADLLGISRPTLIKLLEAGKLPCDKPSGSRHRRLLLSDVLEYQQRRRAERSGVLDQLVSDAEDDGLYDPPPEDYLQAIREARSARSSEI